MLDFKKCFKEYNVPLNLREISEKICKEFNIKGICDPMYICNVIAYESNIGDGDGNFTGYDISNVSIIAKRLQKAYRFNIPENEIKKLEFILAG